MNTGFGTYIEWIRNDQDLYDFKKGSKVFLFLFRLSFEQTFTKSDFGTKFDRFPSRKWGLACLAVFGSLESWNEV